MLSQFESVYAQMKKELGNTGLVDNEISDLNKQLKTLKQVAIY